MNQHRSLTQLAAYVLTTALLVLPPEALANATNAPARTGGTVIFLVDRSDSVGQLPTPDTVQALIAHYVQIAALARTPMKFAAVVYSGDGVKVIGDRNGGPTLAYETFLDQLDQEFPRPTGTTPLVEALETLQSILAKLPAGEPVIIIHCGDGQPLTALDPTKYPPVAKLIQDRITAVTENVPAEEQQEKIDELRRQWNDPETPEGKRIWKIYLEQEFQACKRLVGGLRERGARVVSVDFNGVESLRELHAAAGGTPDDYLLVQPANRLFEVLHERGLTRYDGIVASKPMEVKESKGEKRAVDLPLDDVTDAAVITVVFPEPIPDFANHLRVGFQVDGQTLELAADLNTPNARLSYDSAGRVATATLVLPTIPSSRKVAFGCKRKGDSPLPNVMIYRYQRLASGLEAVLRPVNSQPSDSPPFVVSPNQPVIWQAYLHNRESNEPVPLAGIDVVLRDIARGHSNRFELVPDADGIFKTPTEVRLPHGNYDADVTVVFAAGGEPLVLRLADHIHSQFADEHVTLEIDEATSASAAFIDAGELGDARIDAVVKCRLRSRGANYPLPLKLTVLDLADNEGALLPADVVKLSQTALTVQPGQPTPWFTVRCKVPEQLGEVADGPIEGRLAITRTDVDVPVEIQPHNESITGDVPPSTIRFYLRRPQIQLAAPRAGRDQLRKHKDTLIWPVRVDIWKPFHRAMELRVCHTSEVERELSVVLSGPFRTSQGRTCPSIVLSPADEGPSSRLIPSGACVVWRYDLAIPADLPDELVSATLEISGGGLRKSSLPIVIDARKPLIAPSLRRLFAIAASGLFVRSLLALIRIWRLRPFRRGAAVEIRPDRPFGFITVQPGRRGEAMLALEGEDITRRYREDTHDRPAKPREIVAPDEVSESNPLILSRRQGDDVLAVAVERIETDSAGPIVFARVEEPGLYDQRRSGSGRRLRRAILGTLLFGSLAMWIYHARVVAMLQWCSDAIGGI